MIPARIVAVFCLVGAVALALLLSLDRPDKVTSKMIVIIGEVDVAR